MAWHSALNDVPWHHDEHYVDRRCAVVFRENEFRTPSPLLPSWHQSHPFNTSAMDDNDSNEDCYFHSSENIHSSYFQQPDIKPMNYQAYTDSLSGSQIMPLEAADGYQLRCRDTDFADNCESKLVRVDGILDERTCTGSKLFNSRRPIIARRSKPILDYIVCHFYHLFFCCC